MEKENVPADPTPELSVCAPLAVLVRLTVSGVPGPVIWNEEGMLIEKTWPPSPLTEYVARVGTGELRPTMPVPVKVRCPFVALTATVPLPLLGRRTFPKFRPAPDATAIGRNTLATARPAVEPAVGVVGATAT